MKFLGADGCWYRYVGQVDIDARNAAQNKRARKNGRRLATSGIGAALTVTAPSTAATPAKETEMKERIPIAAPRILNII